MVFEVKSRPNGMKSKQKVVVPREILFACSNHDGRNIRNFNSLADLFIITHLAIKTILATSLLVFWSNFNIFLCYFLIICLQAVSCQAVIAWLGRRGVLD